MEASVSVKKRKKKTYPGVDGSFLGEGSQHCPECGPHLYRRRQHAQGCWSLLPRHTRGYWENNCQASWMCTFTSIPSQKASRSVKGHLDLRVRKVCRRIPRHTSPSGLPQRCFLSWLECSFCGYVGPFLTNLSGLRGQSVADSCSQLLSIITLWFHSFSFKSSLFPSSLGRVGGDEETLLLSLNSIKNAAYLERMLILVEAKGWFVGAHKTVFTTLLCTFENSHNKKRKKGISLYSNFIQVKEPGWCVAQWIKRCPMDQEVTFLIPSQGICTGYGLYSQ